MEKQLITVEEIVATETTEFLRECHSVEACETPKEVNYLYIKKKSWILGDDSFWTMTKS